MSPRFCVAVDEFGNAVVYKSGKWMKPHLIDRYSTPVSVNCPTSAFCVSADDSGRVISYDGRTWSKPRLIDAGARLSSVSCAGFAAWLPS